MIKMLRESLAAHIKGKYGVQISIALEKPPKLELGEAASPVCFELAKRLKRAPRQIAQEISTSLPAIPGVARIEVAGAGYLNVFLDRGAFWQSLFDSKSAAGQAKEAVAEKVIVEHTSINPNKAAHIGQLRNAVLGHNIDRIMPNESH